MRNPLKSKLIVGILCIVLAAAVAFVGIPALNRTKTSTRIAVRVRVDVPQGTKLTSEMLTAAEVGAYGLPEGIVTDQEAAVGLRAKENLYAGELLWEERLQTEEAYQAEFVDKTMGLSGGRRLVTITLPSPASGIAGVLRAGNTVDVYEYVEEEDEEGAEVCHAKLVQGTMTVFDVLNRDLESLTALDEQLEALPEGETADLDFVPCYVVFRCSDAEAQELIRLENTETMHLVLRKAGG